MPDPIAVREATAAAMFDMPVSKFRALVKAGAMPKPLRIGGSERWPVEKLRAVISGDAGLPAEDFEL